MERETGLLLMCFLSPFIVLDCQQQIEAGSGSGSGTVQCCSSPDEPCPVLSRYEKAFEPFIDVAECDLFW